MNPLFSSLGALSAPLSAARLLREEILASPVRPDQRESLRAAVLDGNAATPAERAALAFAASGGRAAPSPLIGADDVVALAERCGSAAWRSLPGDAFHAQPAPLPARIPELFADVLEIVNAPRALEAWPPVVRAFALHFLLRLVQPFACPAGALAQVAEAWLLAGDGFAPDRVLLPEARVVAGPIEGRPDPDGFAGARASRLVERLAETRLLVREATGRAVLRGWVAERAAGLNARQERLLLYLAGDRAPAALRFRDYVDLHAGRRAPSLRTLQRDWQGLRAAGWLRRHDGASVLDVSVLALEPVEAVDGPGT